jgi:hypothetical protein
MGVRVVIGKEQVLTNKEREEGRIHLYCSLE